MWNKKTCWSISRSFWGNLVSLHMFLWLSENQEDIASIRHTPEVLGPWHDHGYTRHMKTDYYDIFLQFARKHVEAEIMMIKRNLSLIPRNLGCCEHNLVSKITLLVAPPLLKSARKREKHWKRVFIKPSYLKTLSPFFFFPRPSFRLLHYFYFSIFTLFIPYHFTLCFFNYNKQPLILR